MKYNEEAMQKVVQGRSEAAMAKATARQECPGLLKLSGRIAMRVRTLLREQGLSQTELASRMGVTPAQVSKLLSGSANIELKTIARMEEVLGRKIISVAGFDGPAYETPPQASVPAFSTFYTSSTL